MATEFLMKVSIDDEEISRKLEETEDAMKTIVSNLSWLSDLINFRLSPANKDMPTEEES